MKKEMSPCPCKVCGKPTIAFNYGVNCCNACKQFYKRIRDSKNIPMRCRMGGQCGKCRYCRYQACLEAGLQGPTLEDNQLCLAPKNSTPQLPSVLQHLQHLEHQRRDTFLNFFAVSDFNLDELILSESTCYIKKDPDAEPKFSDWTTLILSTSVDLIKRFELTRNLSKSEKMDFVKSSFRKHAIFCIAMSSYSNQKESTEFPGGMDTLPGELTDFYEECPEVLGKIRCDLVAKLKDLEITNEEFLLLSAIMISNPDAKYFSTLTQSHIGRYQQLFVSCLMQYCMQNYQSYGPIRYSELLSVFCAINRTLENFDSAIINMQCIQPKVKVEKIFIDMLN